MIGLFIYLSGVIVTVVLFYRTLEKGCKVTVFELFFSLLLSLCSWVAFVSMLFIIYGDKEVFTKK